MTCLLNLQQAILTKTSLMFLHLENRGYRKNVHTHLLCPERRSRAVSENRGGQNRHHNFAHRHRPPERRKIPARISRWWGGRARGPRIRFDWPTPAREDARPT